MTTDRIIPKRALLSVSDKSGIVEFAQGLQALGVALISTGGTAQCLTDAGVKVTLVSDLTKFPEIMQGRVKTLHPKVFAGILGKRDDHASEAEEHDVDWIDLVVCNLYPFIQTISQPDVTFDLAIEQIDIGGPSMVRAAAKNMEWTSIVVDHCDYDRILDELREEQGVSFATRKRLAAKAFSHTAQYDSVISTYLNEDVFPDELTLGFNEPLALRYGENPHQIACAYRDPMQQLGVLQGAVRQGKPLSYNNIADADAALFCVSEFEAAACVVVKHANPCGVATGMTIDEALGRAWEADSKSAFGSVIALNEPCNEACAMLLKDRFVEVVIAPGFSDEALSLLAPKSNMRLIDVGQMPVLPRFQFRSVIGGLLIQSHDDQFVEIDALECVTNERPSASQLSAMAFAWQVVKHIKSNAILVAREGVTVGVGAGQVSRVDAVDIALKKMGDDAEGVVLASDAFFPFRDSIDLIAKAGVKAIIQPGGSKRDDDIIDACNEFGIAMVFTGDRCFKH